jgi:outer membrane protein assembly factor BamB
VDKRTGREVWRTDRAEFRRGFSTPFVWRHDGLEELIVTGSLWLKAYDLQTGRERWSILGLARVANASPVAGDGLLFVSSWNIGSDAGDRMIMPPFADYAVANDKNKDGRLALEEMAKDPFRDRFGQIDVNKDRLLSAEEWTAMVGIFDKAENSLFAVRPGGRGDITKTHVAWKNQRSLPYVSSPLYYDGRIYTFKSGGLASCYVAKTGRVLYQDERIGATGDFYASAVAANGLVLIANQRGTVVVLRAGDTLEVLARNEMGEPVFATPAVVDGIVYLRTEKRLFAFGPGRSPESR